MMSEPSSRRQRIDRYEILTEIASGGMATVYLARLASAPGFERIVAIKRLHPHLERQQDFVEMFLDEGRIAARIHHPNVVSTLEFGSSEHGHYLVMDYVEGPTLAKLLAKSALEGERLPAPVALRIALDSLAGLQVAHDLTDDDGKPLEVVHRDVSPQNILVGLDGTARITDFGVARATERLAVTRTGQLKGKLSYMAPEQARGEPTDRRADVFAMGVILWEALAGRRLFRGKTDTEAETLSKVLYDPIPRISDVFPEIHPTLDAICARALERAPDARFASCAEFAEAIERATSEGVTLATTREVARLIEQSYGHELSQRRAIVRQLRPADELTPSRHEERTAADTPAHLSSVSSAALSVEASSPSMPRLTPVVDAPPPRHQGLLLGALGAALLVTVAAVATLVWVILRPTPLTGVSPASSGAPPLASSAPAVVSAPATVLSAPPVASSAPVASASARRKPPAVPAVPATTGGLQANPYRR